MKSICPLCKSKINADGFCKCPTHPPPPDYQAIATLLADALKRLEQWADAYPLDVFPEPDWKKVRRLLNDGGESLDRVSASNMRHVIIQTKGIVRTALSAFNTAKGEPHD